MAPLGGASMMGKVRAAQLALRKEGLPGLSAEQPRKRAFLLEDIRLAFLRENALLFIF